MNITALRGKSLPIAFLCLLTSSFAPHAQAQSVIATIPTSDPPGEIDINPVEGRAYVPVDNHILVVNETTNKVVHTLTIGVSLGGVAVNPLTSMLYAVDAAQGEVYVINTKNWKTVATIPVSFGVYAVVNPLSNKIYVSDNMYYVTVIDGATNKVSSSIVVDSVHCLAVNPLTNRIYAAQGLYPGKIAVIDGDTDQVLTSVSTGGNDPFAVAVDYFRNVVYTTNANSVGVISGASDTLSSTIPLATELSGVAVDPIANLIYVDNEFTNQVEIISGLTQQMTGTVSVGATPFLSAVDFYRGQLYVGDFGTISDQGYWVNSAVSVVKLAPSLMPTDGAFRERFETTPTLP